MKLYRAARVLTYLFIGAIVVMLVPPLRNNLIPVWPHAWRQLSTLQVRVLDSILFFFFFLGGSTLQVRVLDSKTFVIPMTSY